MRIPATYRLPMAALLLVVLVACGGTPPPQGDAAFPTPANAQPAASAAAVDAAALARAPCPDADGPISGPIVFGMNNNLAAIGADGGSVQELTRVGGGLFAYEPAWSPDGRTLAFTLSRPADDPDLSWLPVGIICGIDRDTGKGRTLAQGAAPLEGLNEPAWSPDGAALLVTRHQPQRNEQKQYTGDNMSLARYDLTTQTFEPLAESAMSATLSRDGKRIAYVALNPVDLTATLMAGDAGGAADALPPTEPPLFLVLVPRWSPDGSRLAFSASGGDPIEPQPSPAARGWLDRLLGVKVALAHGPPTDVWLSDGVSRPERLTRLGLDDARVAWSPDGTQLAIASGLGGIMLLDVATGQQRQLTDQGNYGGIAWAVD